MVTDALINKIKEKKNPTVVGLDPRLMQIPKHLKNEAINNFGKTMKAVGFMFTQFNKAIIDACFEIIPAVKPQIAMYEQYGYEGIKAYIETIEYAKSKGLVVIGDIKRNDIASTAKAYSDGHIGKSDIDGEKVMAFQSDYITINPYLGADSIEPFLENCKAYDKGLFVLVKTSNPGGGLFQDLVTKDGFTIYEKVAEYVESIGKDFIGEFGYSSIGAVVGATYPEQLKKLREIARTTFFLIPGYGAQGGKAEDIVHAFDNNGLGAIVNSSRGIIEAYLNDAYKNKFSETEFALAAFEAAKTMQGDLRRNIDCLKNM